MKMNLISARKARGLTQGDIANALHLAVTTVFKWERGIAPVARKHWKNPPLSAIFMPFLPSKINKSIAK